MASPEAVRFGSFELDLSTGELRRQGRRVALQSQPAQVLCLLVRNAGRVVMREELRKAVWAADTFVEFDAALNVAVQKIRQALVDSATTPRFVETIPKRGYRFLADVRPVEPAPAVSRPDTGRARIQRGPGWTALAVAAVILSVLVGERLLRRPQSSSPTSVAVLPFEPLVAAARDEALEIGIAEAVIVKLGEMGHLRVPSISAVRRYTGPDRDPVHAGRELDVDAVLDGSLLVADGTLRVSARLLDVRAGTALWARQWDLPWTDVFAVQDALAAEVTRALTPTLAPQERAEVIEPPMTAATYERYLRGRHLIARRTLEDSRRAAELLEEAVRMDPGSAPAHAALADAYVAIPWMGGDVEPSASRAKQAALRAVELDPDLAEARAMLGTILAHYDWDPDAAEKELQRALELGPDDAVVLRWYSVHLWQEARFEEALELNERELALDPTSVFAHRNRAIILYYARRYEECVDQSLATIELDRYFATAYKWLGKSYEQLGREREAVEAFITPLTFSDETQSDAAELRAAFARGGIAGFWRRWLEIEVEKPDPHNDQRALAYVRLHDRERALELLERLVEDRSPWVRMVAVEPLWDPLRSDPRFQVLLRRANPTSGETLARLPS